MQRKKVKRDTDKTRGRASALVRLMTEYRQWNETPPQGITAMPVSDENLFEWNATINGPAGTKYEGNEYSLVLKIPDDYPFSPPAVRLTSPIEHPNIHNGTICISILTPGGEDYSEFGNLRWSPAHSIESVLISVMSLLGDLRASQY